MSGAVSELGAGAAVEQQRDYLCGPFHGARVLLDAGVSEWEGTPVDQDLVALHAGTTLPAHPREPQVPAGATSLRNYRYALSLAEPEAAGTTAEGLKHAIEYLSANRLECVPLCGPWSGAAVEGVLEAAPGSGARLLANLRTGPLWSSQPPIEALLSLLEGGQPRRVPPEWDVGHFVELRQAVRGRGGTLVVVRDSYPTLGWNGHYGQPSDVVAAALRRDDGREGGVLAVADAVGAEAVRQLAGRLGLGTQLWNN